MRILLLGSLPPPVGGTSVSFSLLVEAVQQLREIDCRVLDLSATSGGAGTRPAAKQVYMSLRCVREVLRSDVVSLHASPPGIATLGPPLLALCRLAGRPLVLRAFGGSLDIEFDEMSVTLQKALRWTFGCDRFLVQTKGLVERLQTRFPGGNWQWFPTSRSIPGEPAPLLGTHSRGARRFVFVGHVKPTKGVLEIMEAADTLGLDIQVDVYGPLLDGLRREQIERSRYVNYAGVISPKDVCEVVGRYDALLLPTYHYGEGYPGAIIEAYAAGRPVIATRWRALPEIVEHGVSGLLVQPQNAAALAHAIRQLYDSPRLLEHLADGARRAAASFSTATWGKRFVEICKEVAR